MAHPGDDSLRRKLLAGLLAAVIVLGSPLLWIGVPLAGFWAAGQLTSRSEEFLLFALAAVPLTMVLVGFGLYRVNALYVSLRGGERREASRSGWLVSHTDERRSMRLRRGRRELIDVAMTASIVVALVLMVVWFFFLAHMRLAPLP